MKNRHALGCTFFYIDTFISFRVFYLYSRCRHCTVADYNYSHSGFVHLDGKLAKSSRRVISARDNVPDVIERVHMCKYNEATEQFANKTSVNIKSSSHFSCASDNPKNTIYLFIRNLFAFSFQTNTIEHRLFPRMSGRGVSQ